MTATSTLVDKLAGALGARMSRRGFFARSAVVGSAIAVNPATYVLTPTDAYAAVCSCQGQNCDCGSLCCDGYTEFCCTLTGRNQCPPGSLLAGWWKVDGTGFCDGPRYYMDCNAPCNGCGCGSSGVCDGACSGTGCGCANGDCNNRKAGCTKFRYGQCNQGVACVGPIICRIVTCIAPWQIDGTCTTTARYDAATAYHDRPCLHNVVGSVDSVSEVSGGLRVTGWALDYDTNGPIDVHVYIDGQWGTATTASAVRNDVAAAIPGMGPYHGFDVVIPASAGVHNICVYGINAGPSGNGNALVGCATGRVGNPFGNLEGWRRSGNQITVVGWVIDPDTTSPTDVHVYVDGQWGGAFTANVPRSDVGQAFPAFGPNHGFEATLTLSGGTHQVCVYAINKGPNGTTNPLMGCLNVDIGSPVGGVQKIDPAPGGVLVTGHAFDPDDVSASVQVDFTIDGAAAGSTVADDYFPDLDVFLPGVGKYHGFSAFVPGAPGRRALSVTARNIGVGKDKVIAQTSVSVPTGNPFGSLDIVSAGPGLIRVQGWVIDPDSANPVPVHCYVDGQWGGAFTADVSRPDVAAAYPGYGNVHGFDFLVSAPSGLRRVDVYGINIGPGSTNPLIGTRSTVVGGNPYGNLESVIGGTGTIRLTGWVIDPDVAGPVTIHCYVDGQWGGQFVADRDRPDVGLAFPLYGSGHGFDLTVSAPRGARQVCLYAINAASGTTNPLMGCRTVQVS